MEPQGTTWQSSDLVVKRWKLNSGILDYSAMQQQNWGWWMKTGELVVAQDKHQPSVLIPSASRSGLG